MEWLDALFTVNDSAFGTTKAVHLADIAKGYSIAQTNLDVVDDASDLRTGLLIAAPDAPPTTEEILTGSVRDKLLALGFTADEIGLLRVLL